MSRSARGTLSLVVALAMVIAPVAVLASPATASPAVRHSVRAASAAPTASDYQLTALPNISAYGQYFGIAVNKGIAIGNKQSGFHDTNLPGWVSNHGVLSDLLAPTPTWTTRVERINASGLIIGEGYNADVLTATVALPMAWNASAPSSPTVLIVPAGAAQYGSGVAVNDAGQLIASYRFIDPQTQTQSTYSYFYASATAAPVQIGTGFSATEQPSIIGMANSGAILGGFQTSDGGFGWYLLPSPDATPAQSTPLDFTPRTISPNGTVAGSTGYADSAVTALRSPSGVETHPAGKVDPQSVNDSGSYTGFTVDANQRYTYVLVQDGTVTPMSSLVPGWLNANGSIDNDSDIAGAGGDPSGRDRGFILLHAPGPVASFTSAPASSQPGVLQFISTSTAPSGDTIREDWDFGDGTTGEGAAITHSYTKPGTFHVTLKVTNQAGTTSSITHDSVIAAPTLTSSLKFVDASGATLDTVSPKVGDTIRYKVTLAASQNGVGDLSHVAFVGDPLALAIGSELADVGAASPVVPGDITLHPGDATSFVVTVKVKGAGNIRATTQATATDAGGATVTSDLNQLSFAVGGLKVEITLNPPSYNAEPDANGPKPVDITMTEKITNVTDGRLTGINIRSMDVLRTHVGQLLESTPTLASVVPDPIAGLPEGSLDPGASITVSAVFTVKADGHVQFQSLVTAASATGGTVKGTGSTILSIRVTKVLEFTSRVVNPTGAPLVPAGTPITITGTVHNLTDSATLDVGPLFATTIGNAGLQSLTYDGVGVSPKAFQVPGALILQPGDTKTFTLKALTSYSEPTGGGGVIRSGGTSATFTFTPWAHVTLDDGTEYDTNKDGSEILSTPEDLSRRVSIDDSIPIPDYGTVKNAAIIGGAIMYGGLEGTWNAASGMVTGLINLPNVSASTLWAAVNFQTKVWESFTPEERDAFAHETSYMIVSVLQRNVELAAKGTPALLKQASDYVENYLTQLENARATGQWAEVTAIYTSGAANAIGQVVIPIAIGKMASSSQAITALEANQAELQAKTAAIVERSNGAVTAKEIVPLLIELSTGAELNAAEITRLFGITPAELAEFQKLATTHRYLLTVRARSATSIDWIEKFNAAVKPEALKIKTVSPLDAKLGYSSDKIGSLVFKEPVALMQWKAAGATPEALEGFVQRYVEAQGFAPGTNDYYSAVARVTERIAEWDKWEATYLQWDHQGWMDTTFSWNAQDIIAPEGEGPKFDGFNLEKVGDNEYIVKMYDEKLQEFVPVTGDIDQVAFSHLDGSPLDPDEFVALLDEMRKNPLIQAQHGPAETYTNGGIDFLKEQFKPNEPALQIGPTGIAPRVVRLNEGASKWLSANNKHIVWDGSIVTTGGNPAITTSPILNIDYNAAVHLEPAAVQTIRPLPGNGSQGANVGRCRVTYSTNPTAPLLLMNGAGEISQVTGGSLTASPYQASCFGSGPIIDLPVKPATVTTAPVTAGTHEVPVAAPGPLSAAPDASSGFTIGQTVIIDPGSNQQETAVISGFGSLIFRDGLKFDHPAGATIVVASTPAATAATALAITGNEIGGPLALALLLLLFGGSVRGMARRQRGGAARVR